MKQLALFFALSVAAFAFGAETLRIADATRSSGGAMTAALMKFASGRRGVEVSLRRFDAEDAFEKLDAGELDLVLVNGGEFPTERRGAALRYATAAYVACVSIRNPLRKIGVRELGMLLDIPRPHWEIVGGSAAEIHRIGVADRDGRPVGESLLKKTGGAGEMLLLSSMNEAVIMAESDPVALIWGPFVSELPLSVIALEVEGVPPTRSNIRAGRYPLCIPRFAVSRPEPSAAARAFIEFLRSGEFARLVEEDGELAELPETGR